MRSLRCDMINDVWISTAYRETEIMGVPCGYYETLAWDWNAEEKELGKMRIMREHGCAKYSAIQQHKRIVSIFSYLYYRKRRIQDN